MNGGFEVGGGMGGKEWINGGKERDGRIEEGRGMEARRSEEREWRRLGMREVKERRKGTGVEIRQNSSFNDLPYPLTLSGFEPLTANVQSKAVPQPQPPLTELTLTKLYSLKKWSRLVLCFFYHQPIPTGVS